MSELWNLSPVESGLLAQRVDHTQQAATTALQGSERQDGNNGENNNRDKEVNGVPGVSAAGLQAEASDRGQSAREEEGTSANGVYSELALVLAPLASFFSVFEAAKPVKKVELLEKLPPDVLLKLKEVTTALQQAPGLAQQLQRHRPGLQQAGRGPAVTAGADGAAAAAYCGATSAPAGGEGIGTVGSDADVEDDDAGEGAEGEEAAGGAAKKTGKVPGKSRTNRQKAARAANYYAENAIKKFEYKVPKKHKEAGKGPLAVIAAAADPVRGTASYGVGVHPASILIELRATTLAAAVAKYTPGMSVMGVVEKIMLSALAIVNPLEGTELDAATIRERFGSLQQRWSRDWVRYLAGAFGGLLNNVQQCLPQLLQRVVRPRRPATAATQVAAAAVAAAPVGAPEQQQAAHMAAAVDSGGPGAAATAAQAEVAGAAAAAGSSQVPGGGAGAPGARTLAVSAGRQVATAATYTAGGGGPDGRGGSDASHREPMDGNEIWELNKRLGQLAERLADPADLEPQPKRKKSLTLQEKCHNAWGVKGYAGRLDELYGGDDTLDDTTLPDYIPFTLLAESGEGGDDDDDALLGQGLRGGLAGLAGDNGGSAGAPLGLGDGDRSGARPGPSPGTPSSSSGSGSRDSRGNRTVMDLVSDAEAEEVAPAAGFEAVYQGFGSNDGFVDFEDDVQVTTRCAVGGILRATLDAADPGARQAFCRVFEKGGLTEVLVKYEPNSATRLALSRSVLQRFKRGAMINDEVVTLYKHLLQDRDTREQKRHIATAAAAAAAAAGAAASDAQAASAAAVADVVAKGAPPAGSSSTQGCHFFGPNFYDKLFKDNVKKGKRGGGTGSSDGGTGNGDGGTGNGDGGAGKGHGHFVYKNVKEWTSAPRLKVAGQIYFRQSVLERRHIFIPVHLDLHWVCVEVYLAPDVASSELRCYDPLMRTETDQRAKDAQEVLQNVAVWVESEAKAKMAKDLRLEPQWQATRWRRVFIASPKQRSDSNNCAIFMLAYMNRRSAGLEPNHSEEDADRLRIEMVYSLMQRCIS